MNHFHPAILIVLVERHPHALNKSSLNAGRWHKWQNNHRSVSRRLCSSSDSPTAARCPSWDQGSLWNSSFKDFLGFSAGINGNYVLSVYVIVTQLRRLQKYSCGHKLYHLKIWNNRSKFEYMGYQSLEKHSSERAVKLNSAGGGFQDHSFIQEGTIPWAEHGKCHNKPQTGPTPFSRRWNQPGPCCHSHLLHHQRFYPLKIIWSRHASATFVEAQSVAGYL